MVVRKIASRCRAGPAEAHGIDAAAGAPAGHHCGPPEGANGKMVNSNHEGWKMKNHGEQLNKRTIHKTDG